MATTACGALPIAGLLSFGHAYLAVLVLVLTAFALRACLFSPWLPTSTSDLERIRRLAALDAGETFYDLGSGDGRVAAYLSRTSTARCVGVELSPFHYAIGLLRKGRARFRLGDLFAQDLSDADVVFVYATPASVGELAAKLGAELRSGARLLVYAHLPSDGHPRLRLSHVDEGRRPIRVYRVL